MTTNTPPPRLLYGGKSIICWGVVAKVFGWLSGHCHSTAKQTKQTKTPTSTLTNTQIQAVGMGIELVALAFPMGRGSRLQPSRQVVHRDVGAAGRQDPERQAEGPSGCEWPNGRLKIGDP